MLEECQYLIIPLICGWLLDRLLGDPEWLLHPVVIFGKAITFAERYLNKGRGRVLKGALVTLMLVLTTYFATKCLLIYSGSLSPFMSAIIVFFSLSGKGLIKEVKLVFKSVESSIEDGRVQLSRIVGRDTDNLSANQIRKAALETLSENLNDGVIAPLFWYMLLGAAGMLAYKMVNTLDSMIGYKNEKYLLFGKCAARVDDIANFIPSRVCAVIMIIVSGRISKISFLFKYGKCHSSPNSGYPEAALAAILDCRFGGPSSYSGQINEKPFIGVNNREFNNNDLCKAVRINIISELLMLVLITTIIYIICPELY
ncbi:MAG: adenosylcobinamide-phosphate synthase CbiB [Rikenellaceae bacterium]|nr:adenosylcobinamide-phosphate synthase CbiB [Rikenellaceae bacterium]